MNWIDSLMCLWNSISYLDTDTEQMCHPCISLKGRFVLIVDCHLFKRTEGSGDPIGAPSVCSLISSSIKQ